ncbi:MAG: polyprenyl synthetase family protein [Desulfomonilaceae bacterium]
MDLDLYLAERKRLVDQALEEMLPGANEGGGRLHEAMRYSLFAGGKRIRPILALEAGEIVGADASGLLPLAVALECIHTYSLIHDDLPAMDDDDTRRGKPTLHRVFGEAVAILVGDALLTFAFDVLSSPHAARTYPAHRLLQAIHELAVAAGFQGLVKGQYLDIVSEGREVNERTVSDIVAGKTGALLRASLVCGALLGGGSSEQIRMLGEFGDHLGIVFQIKDDVLDIEGDPQTLGKAVHKDQEKGKATYPAIMGLDAAKNKMRQHIERALRTLEPFGQRASTLSEICLYIGQRIK